MRKRDTIVCDHSFLKQFSEPSLEDVTPLQYFSMFITTALLDIVVEQTNIYSFEIIHKSINTGCAKMMSLIGMSNKMGILKLPSYKSYWSRELCCPRIADVMPRNCYQELLRYLLVKTEIEEFNLVGKQIIPSKSICLSANTIWKSQKKLMFVLASLVLCMTCSLMMGKTLQS